MISAVHDAADGSWSTTLAPVRSVLVRALHPQAPAVTSDVVEVSVVPVLSLSLVSTSPLRVEGTITPFKRRVTVDVYKLSGPHRHLVVSRRVAVHGGHFSARLSLPRRARGRYVVIARSRADAVTAAGASPPVDVTL